MLLFSQVRIGSCSVLPKAHHRYPQGVYIVRKHWPSKRKLGAARGMRTKHDHLIVAVVIGILAVLAYGILRHHGRPVELGDPEYDQYIEGRVTVCIRERLARDMERNRGHLPVRPTPREREATCRLVVLEFDKWHPEARP